MRNVKEILLACLLSLLCAPTFASEPPIQPVAHVDLPRFMGKWYLIASIPTRFEKNACNAIETYALQPDGTIKTTFRFNNDSVEGPLKHIHSTAYVRPGTGNAEWGVQIFWPLKAQYIVAYLKPDYSEMIVARDKRDYVWVFARTPTIPQSDYDALIARVGELGYPLADVRKVPQQWPELNSIAAK